MAVSINQNQPDEPVETQGFRWMLFIGTCLILVAASLLTYLEYELTSSGGSHPETHELIVTALLAQWVLVSLFPISAIAYVRSVKGVQQAETERDFSRLNTENRGTQLRNLSQTYSNSNYVLLSIPVVLFTVLGSSLFYRPPLKLPFIPDDMLPDMLSAVRFGFLGAYVFCFQLIRRRYSTRDLQPFVYMSCAGVLLAGMVFNFVAFSAINVLTRNATVEVEKSESPDDKKPRPASPDGTPMENQTSSPAPNPTGVGAGLAAIIAFSLGYFQYLALRWFRQLAHAATRQQERRSSDLQLGLIDGLSQLHEERLRDEGIDNLQNLAAADLDQLVGNTPFNSQEIIDWVDQAVLYLYLEPNEIESFRRGGIRSVTDFQDHWRAFCIMRKRQISGELIQVPKPTKQLEDDRKAWAQQLQSTPERLDALYRTTEAGPNMHRIETYWQSRRTESLKATGDADSLARARMGAILRDKVRQLSNAGGPDVVRDLIASLYHRADADRSVWCDTANSEEIVGQAWLARKLNQLDEAIALYTLAKDRFPDDPVAFNDLAWLCMDLLKDAPANESTIARYEIDAKVALEDSRTAVRLARKNSEHRATLPGLLDTLAWAEFHNGDLENSAKTIREATRMWVDLNGLPVHECLKKMFTTLDAADPPKVRGDVIKSILAETSNLMRTNEEEQA
ncbi:MAG: hypothetical protein H8E66_23480 [Planctomycetes bacterium]|nr:hypothetical protein [Planctomycetota bacterium]